jgi:hypothetical protein
MLTTRFLFPKFFPKKFGQKIGAVLQLEILGMVCVRVRFCSTPPPFRADEKHRGVFLSAGIPAAFRRRAELIDDRLSNARFC